MASTLPLKRARFLYLNKYHFLLLRQQVHSYPYAYGPKPQFPCRSIATTTAPAKTDWLIIVPDYTGVLVKRMEVRPKHFEELGAGLESGFWKMGGAMLEEPPQEGAALKIIGSSMMAHAATKEEVLEMLKKDIYARSGVWDLGKIQIYPFKTAFRNP